MEFEQAVQREHIDCSELTTPQPSQSYKEMTTSILVGEYVKVEEDLSKGMKSFGGNGWVTAARKADRQELHDIIYVDGSSSRKESNVPVRRITVVTSSHQATQLSTAQMHRRSTRIQEEKQKNTKVEQGCTNTTKKNLNICLTNSYMLHATINYVDGGRKSWAWQIVREETQRFH